jgi:hypothetical protein
MGPTIKKERQEKPCRSRRSKTSRLHRKEKEKPMRFANSTSTIGTFGSIVNGLTVFAMITFIAIGYFSALGSFAGAA